MAAGVDGQIAKLKNSEAGYAMQNALDTERGALSSYVKGLDGQGGTTIGNNETMRQARGQTVAGGLGALDDWADTKRRSLYTQADQDSGGKPVFTGNFHGLISGDQADFIATPEGTSLLKGIQARGKTLGFWDANGDPQPVKVQNAEQMRQFLNRQWSPQTAGIVRDAKGALDTDVFTTGEGTPYAPARQFTQWQKNTLDNPNGIASMMDSSGAVNRKVAFEDIGKKAESMPAAQFDHVVNTLRNPPPDVPAPVQAKMQAAVQALKSDFASQLSEASDKTAGQANTRGVTKFMNDNSSKLQTLFNSPAEQLWLKNINDAHNILRYDASYPGAAAQTDILTKSGAATWAHRSITGLGGLAGGAIGSAYGPAGMATGASLGAGMAAPLASKVSGGMAERAALKATQGRLTSLRDLAGTSAQQ
jgi:predicted secreted protein